MNTSTNERAKDASDEERWQAILQKDRNADGKFFFSVRPRVCAALLPGASGAARNVAFHKSAEDAERAGFRACKRCKPRGPAPPGKHAIVAAACRAIETGGIARPNRSGELGRMSPFISTGFSGDNRSHTEAFAEARRSERMRKELSKRNTQ